jgi:hypothetical protein
VKRQAVGMAVTRGWHIAAAETGLRAHPIGSAEILHDFTVHWKVGGNLGRNVGSWPHYRRFAGREGSLLSVAKAVRYWPSR